MAVKKVSPDDPKDDRYYVVLYNPNGGSQYKKVVRGKRNAEAHEAEMKVTLTTGQVAPTRRRGITVKEWMTELLEANVLLGRGSRGLYERICRLYIYPAWEHRKVAEVARSPLQVRAFLDGIEARYGKGARPNVEMLVRMMFNAAADEGIIAKSPLARTKSKKVGRVKPVWGPQVTDVVRLHRAMADCRRGLTRGERILGQHVVPILFGTGVRAGELYGIDPTTDLDHASRKLKIRRQVQVAPGGEHYYCPPKDGSTRDIPLAPFAYEALVQLERELGTAPITLAWEEVGDRQDAVTHNLIWRSFRKSGRPYNQGNLRNRLRRTGVELGLAGAMHPHLMRHAMTTELHHGGVPQKVIDEVTGHASRGSESLTTYTYVLEIGRERVREALQDAWEKASAEVGLLT